MDYPVGQFLDLINESCLKSKKKSFEKLVEMLAFVTKMKRYLNKFQEELNKDKKISLDYILNNYFYFDRVIIDKNYLLKKLLKDEEDVVDLYLSSIIDNVESVETLEKDELKDNVKRFYQIFSFCYCSEKYEKVVEIIQEFENRESFKKLNEDWNFPHT